MQQTNLNPLRQRGLGEVSVDESVGDELTNRDERELVDIAAMSVIPELDACLRGACDPVNGVGEHLRQGARDREPICCPDRVIRVGDGGCDGQAGELPLGITAQRVQPCPGRLSVLGEDVQVEEDLGIRLSAERGGAGANRSEKALNQIVVEAVDGGAGNGNGVLPRTLVAQKELLLLLLRHAVVAVVLAEVRRPRLPPPAWLAVDGNFLHVGGDDSLALNGDGVRIDSDLGGEALTSLGDEGLLELVRVLDSDDGHRILADTQEDGAASRKIREGRQCGTEGVAGVLGECLRLDLKAVAALQCQTSEGFREVSQIDNHMSIVHKVSMKGPRVSMKCR